MRRSALVLGLFALSAGCAGADEVAKAPSAAPSAPAPAPTDAATASASGPSFRDVTSSPKALTEALSADDRALYALCGEADEAVAETARESARQQLGGGDLFGPEELAFSLRRAGDPHVWPRGWSIAGVGLDEADTRSRVERWAASQNPVGKRRCGVGRATGPDGTSVVAAVTVDALADIAPLPTRARLGQWLTLDGVMLVPAKEVKVVLLGPRGAPKTVPSSLDRSRIRSSFAVDQRGGWLVQVLATVATGPRPVLEALVFVGDEPPTEVVKWTAPGEDAGAKSSDENDALVKMVNAARQTEGLGALKRDPALDRFAAAHAEKMRAQKLLGHDVGDGSLRERLDAASAREHLVGENVASASTLVRAHRSLWASPSHRANLLHPGFRRIGVSVLHDETDTVWVAQVFAD